MAFLEDLSNDEIKFDSSERTKESPPWFESDSNVVDIAVPCDFFIPRLLDDETDELRIVEISSIEIEKSREKDLASSDDELADE